MAKKIVNDTPDEETDVPAGDTVPEPAPVEVPEVPEEEPTESIPLEPETSSGRYVDVGGMDQGSGRIMRDRALVIN